MIKNNYNQLTQYLMTVYVTVGMAAGSYYLNHWFLPAPAAVVHKQVEGQEIIPDESDQGIYIHLIQ